MGGVIVDNEVDVEVGRHGCIDSIEEAPKLDGTMASVTAAEGVTGGDIEGAAPPGHTGLIPNRSADGTGSRVGGTGNALFCWRCFHE
jgi:hypothetical protein